MFLTPDEVRALTGKQKFSAQCRALQAMGVPFFTRPNGSPAVLRTAIDRTPGSIGPKEPELMP